MQLSHLLERLSNLDITNIVCDHFMRVGSDCFDLRPILS
jgi:hypothetical protein